MVAWMPEVIEVVAPPVSKDLKKRWSHFIRKVYETDPLTCPFLLFLVLPFYITFLIPKKFHRSTRHEIDSFSLTDWDGKVGKRVGRGCF